MGSRRIALLALLAAFALVAAACGGGAPPVAEETTTTAAPTDDTDTTEPEETTTTEAAEEATQIGMVFDIGGRGDQSFNDSAAAGLDRAKEDFNIEGTELEPEAGGENREELLRLLSEQGTPLIFAVGFLFTDAVAAAAEDFPEVNYGLIDAVVEAPNVASLVFAEHEGSFLVGAAAALNSETGRVGFIGGVEIDLIKRFEAGFVAGAQHIDPDIEIDIAYISQPPDFSGFNDPARGQEIALGQFSNGADVIYHAAGGSGAGLFEAARQVSEQSGSKVWGIGVDSDQYQTVAPEVQEFVLTSMLKRVDVAVYNTIEAFVTGNLAPGVQVFDLSVDGVGYSTSGGFVDDIAPELDELKAQIVAGEIEVPDAPE